MLQRGVKAKCVRTKTVRIKDKGVAEMDKTINTWLKEHPEVEVLDVQSWVEKYWDYRCITYYDPRLDDASTGGPIGI